MKAARWTAIVLACWPTWPDIPEHVMSQSNLRTCRYNHCALYDPENKRLVVFGGRNAERKRLNDVHFLDIATFTW
eukprot:1146208-Pelagomonas_calceolata.AAC.8